ncbi:TraB/GumN family protein [Methylobacterium sp. WSM2598]|uniref:TraB/GumN family protein n=1 Tax=Methylobacterium sp. WSM2598 TaxID=398261 RepID=UPI00039D47F7|nr:TraB/GumN family protein [Methylobacterium sp. WSM2598]
MVRAARAAAAMGRAARLALVTLALAGAGGAEAACGGSDLFPRIRAEAPGLWATIEAGRGLPHAGGILFRLSRPGRAPSYLLGTLHLNDPRAVAVPPALAGIWPGLRRVALELAETPAALRARRAARVPAAFAAPARHRAARLLPRADLARLRRLVAERGFPVETALALRPAVLALMLDLPACARPAADGSGAYAEQVLAAQAGRAGIAVVGLETLEEQVGAVARLPVPVERALLRAVLRQAPAAEDIVETTLARYAARDTGALLAWMRAPALLPGDPATRLPPAFLDRLLDGRSRRMHRRLRPLLDQGGILAAVGAAHLPGPAGLLRLLEQDGTLVERVE